MKKLGIDVSTWQGTIDWDKVKEANVEFAIIRCGFGNDDPSQDDNFFRRNMEECKRVGIPVGVYLYSYATNTDMAISEANHVLRLISGYQLQYPIYLDMEDASQNSLTGGECTAIILTFANVIEGAGYWCGVYSMASWFGGKITREVTDRLTVWCAQWASSVSVPCDIWQFTDSMYVEGIGNCDGNYGTRDFPAEITGSTGGTLPEPIEPPFHRPSTKNYRVRSGDTLSGIAQNYGTTYQKLAEKNGIVNPDLIYPGQILNI
ncbi:MAG: GH25 family lysozyme [Lachnospiraceae bacterium]